MTWQEMPTILERLAKETTAALSARVADGGDFLSPASPPTTSLHNEEGIRRIEGFADSFRWLGDTPPDVMLDCLTRIHAAQDFVGFVLQEARDIPMNHVAHRPDLPDDQLVRWLLIDYWHYAGVWRQIFRLYSAGRKAV